MTWAYTGQVALMAAVLAGAAFAYAKWLAWDFDRKYGAPDRRDRSEP